MADSDDINIASAMAAFESKHFEAGEEGQVGVSVQMTTLGVIYKGDDKPQKGEKLIVRGHRYVASGQKIKVVTPKTAKDAPSWSAKPAK